MIKNIRGKQLTVLSLSFFLASCAYSPNSPQSLGELIHGVVNTAVYSVVDAIKGYRVNYHSNPFGAKILCKGEVLQGEAPVEKYYDLTPDQKTAQVLELDDCYALWPSGARADIRPAVPLDLYPTFVHIVTLRPSDAPDADTDVAYGEQTWLALQKRNSDIQAASNALANLAINIYALTQTQKNKSRGAASYRIPLQFQGATSRSSSGGIRWTWITSQSGFDPQIKSRPTLTPLFAPDRCLGSVLLGRRTGSVVPTGQIQSYCAGAFVNGECLGSVLLGE